MSPASRLSRLMPLLRGGLLAALCLALLTQCARRPVELNPPADAQRKIVLIAKSGSGDYWNTIKMGAEAAAREWDVNLVFDGPADEGDVAGQIALVRKYLAYGMDGLVLAASDYKALADAVGQAARKGVPVVTIDSEVDSDAVRSFIGIDNYEAGRIAARKIRELTKGKGDVLIVSSYRGARNSELREKGIRDELRSDPAMWVAGAAYCGSGPELCGRQTRALLDQYPAAGGILALNAAAAAGAAEEVKRAGRADAVKIVAFENTQAELEWLQEGVIQATLVQNPFNMGYLGVKTAVQAIEHGKVPARIDTGTKVIDAENMFWLDNQKLLFPFIQ